jgi:tetratricopeptide (TPR) repeat protein
VVAVMVLSLLALLPLSVVAGDVLRLTWREYTRILLVLVGWALIERNITKNKNANHLHLTVGDNTLFVNRKRISQCLAFFFLFVIVQFDPVYRTQGQPASYLYLVLSSAAVVLGFALFVAAVYRSAGRFARQVVPDLGVDGRWLFVLCGAIIVLAVSTKLYFADAGFRFRDYVSVAKIAEFMLLYLVLTVLYDEDRIGAGVRIPPFLSLVNVYRYLLVFLGAVMAVALARFGLAYYQFSMGERDFLQANYAPAAARFADFLRFNRVFGLEGLNRSSWDYLLRIYQEQRNDAKLAEVKKDIESYYRSESENLGSVFFGFGLWESAISPLASRLHENPSDLKVLEQLQICLIKTKEYDRFGELVAQYRYAPRFGSAAQLDHFDQQFVGNAHIALGQIDEANRFLLAARDREDNAYIEFSLGRILFAQKKYEPAIGMFRKSLQLDPRLSEALFWLAKCYTATNDESNAASYRERTLTALPNSLEALRYFQARDRQHEDRYRDLMLRLTPAQVTNNRFNYQYTLVGYNAALNHAGGNPVLDLVLFWELNPDLFPVFRAASPKKEWIAVIVDLVDPVSGAIYRLGRANLPLTDIPEAHQIARSVVGKSVPVSLTRSGIAKRENDRWITSTESLDLLLASHRELRLFVGLRYEGWEKESKSAALNDVYLNLPIRSLTHP